MSTHFDASNKAAALPTSTRDPWLAIGDSNRETLRVLCLPHAGSGASAFSYLTRDFLEECDARIYRYPGRETRMAEQPLQSMKLLVKLIADDMAQLLDKPYVLFGHSMGARVAFELILELDARGLRRPERLVASCSPAPHCAPPITSAYKGPRDAFLRYLRKLGGMPTEILAADELVDVLLPVLSADFALLDGYHPSSAILPCPVTAVYSPDDTAFSYKEIVRWEDLSATGFRLHSVDGGHFYFQARGKPLSAILAETSVARS